MKYDTSDNTDNKRLMLAYSIAARALKKLTLDHDRKYDRVLDVAEATIKNITCKVTTKGLEDRTSRKNRRQFYLLQDLCEGRA
jgi:hypothetical protein